MVVVEGGVSVPHVTVCGFYLLFAVAAFVLVRLRLFPVAPLVLHDVLQKKKGIPESSGWWRKEGVGVGGGDKRRWSLRCLAGT